MDVDLSGVWRVAIIEGIDSVQKYVYTPIDGTLFENYPETFFAFQQSGTDAYQGMYTLYSGPNNPNYPYRDGEIYDLTVVQPNETAGAPSAAVSIVVQNSGAPGLIRQAWSGFCRMVKAYNPDGSDALLMWGVSYRTDGGIAAWVMRREPMSTAGAGTAGSQG